MKEDDRSREDPRSRTVARKKLVKGLATPSIRLKEIEKSETIRHGTERILFVDDEDLLAEFGKEFLEKLGYTVTALTNGAEALDHFRHDPFSFDLVITDQTMPRLSGLGLARRLLRIRGDIPVILCTGHSDTVSPDVAKNAGISTFIMKPLGKKDLAEAVRQVLDARARTSNDMLVS